jgi:hypothetical protein
MVLSLPFIYCSLVERKNTIDIDKQKTTYKIYRLNVRLLNDFFQNFFFPGPEFFDSDVLVSMLYKLFTTVIY